ncbi:MAG TPA: alpha/beta hydrolase, partial [Mycobacteriales bacterium]
TVPSLLLAGERDPVISPKLLPGGERCAPDLRMRVVPGRGHFLAEEDPKLVARAARELFGAR